jgi:hypothetical protein
MLVGFLGLPHGFDLLENNIHDQDKPFNIELEMLDVYGMPFIPPSLFDFIPPWGILLKLQTLVSHFIKFGTLYHG